MLALAALPDALAAGGMVALPALDGWAVLARAGERAHLAALGLDPTTIALTAGDVAVLADFLPPIPLRAQRLVQRLLPGPAAIRLGTDGPLVRLPDHPAWAALAGRGEPLALAPLPATDAASVAARWPALTVLDLPAPPVVGEARLTITAGAPLHVDAAGPYRAAQLADATRLHLLCVCTGNTCRSPMLMTLLRAALARRGLAEVDVASAGTYGGDGHPASAHAVAAMRARGLSLEKHRSQSADELEFALYDRIWCMTAAHAAFLRQLGADPARLEVVNAAEGGVPDPFGGDLADYEACATVLERAAEAIAAGL